MDVGTVTLGYW